MLASHGSDIKSYIDDLWNSSPSRIWTDDWQGTQQPFTFTRYWLARPCTWLHHIFTEWTLLRGYKWGRDLNHEIALSQLVICSGHYGTLCGSVPSLVQITCPVVWSMLRIKLQHQATYNDLTVSSPRHSVSVFPENSWICPVSSRSWWIWSFFAVHMLDGLLPWALLYIGNIVSHLCMHGDTLPPPLNSVQDKQFLATWDKQGTRCGQSE